MSGFASAGGFAMPCAPARSKAPQCVLCFVKSGTCEHCRAESIEAAQRAPQLAMDERPFAPPEAA